MPPGTLDCIYVGVSIKFQQAKMREKGNTFGIFSLLLLVNLKLEFKDFSRILCVKSHLKNTTREVLFFLIFSFSLELTYIYISSASSSSTSPNPSYLCVAGLLFIFDCFIFLQLFRCLQLASHVKFNNHHFFYFLFRIRTFHICVDDFCIIIYEYFFSLLLVDFICHPRDSWTLFSAIIFVFLCVN